MFKTMNKKGYLYVILIFIVILIALLFSNSNDFTGNKGITAKEAESICSPYATNWTENATLVEIRTSSVSNQGEADVWYLVYAVPSEIGNKTDAVEFKVFSDRNVLKIERSPLPYWGKSLEENWTLDSDKLISIATSNERMKEWLSRYHDAEIEDFGMGINLGYSRNPICVISWISWGFLDDPHSARIIIDANTGEVLDFEADLSDGSSYLICLVPLVIIISILLVILPYKSKRFTTFAATGFALFLLPALFLHIYYYSAIFTFMALVFGAVLWKGLEKYMGRDFLKSGDKKVVYGLFGLLAADYFCLIIARFLSISYSYPDLLWSSFIIINVAVLYMILSLTSEEEGTGKILRFFCR